MSLRSGVLSDPCSTSSRHPYQNYSSNLLRNAPSRLHIVPGSRRVAERRSISILRAIAHPADAVEFKFAKGGPGSLYGDGAVAKVGAVFG